MRRVFAVLVFFEALQVLVRAVGARDLDWRLEVHRRDFGDAGLEGCWSWHVQNVLVDAERRDVVVRVKALEMEGLVGGKAAFELVDG